MKFSDLITKKVHIIGINGIGMSALAIYLKKIISMFQEAILLKTLIPKFLVRIILRLQLAISPQILKIKI